MEPIGRDTLAVLLAAGSGSRFAGPGHKLATPMRLSVTGQEKPVIIHALEAMLAAVGDPESPFLAAIVIDGALEVSSLLATDSEVARDVTVVHNPNWQSGQRSTLLCAIAEARSRGCSALVIGLADQPFVVPETWSLLAATDAAIAVATYRRDSSRRRGNPVKLRADVWQFLETETGDPDSGARSLMTQRPDLVVEVPCPGDDHDIDTLEDVPTWNH